MSLSAEEWTWSSNDKMFPAGKKNGIKALGIVNISSGKEEGVKNKI